MRRFDREQGSADDVAETATVAPGKRARTDRLVHEAAARGTEGSGEALPYQATVQRAFGGHDVGHIRAHTGERASAASAAMGADAFAVADQVAFAGMPTLHTVAHEAAHVVQQRGGVTLAGGVGVAGDRHEQHADRVADAVVRGDSAEAMLDEYGPRRGGGSSGGVQRKLMVGDKPVLADAVRGHLEGEAKDRRISDKDLGARERLEGEARDENKTFRYADWTAAARGLIEHDAKTTKTQSVTRGKLTFVNVADSYLDKATGVLELLAQHPSITKFLGARPAFIRLDDELQPAEVTAYAKQVDIRLASWYFAAKSAGFVLGMLMHEFAIHPMADTEEVTAHESTFNDEDIPTGLMIGAKGKEQPLKANPAKADQRDHIFGAIFAMPRNKIYCNAVIEMAEVLVADGRAKGGDKAMLPVTDLLECFLMDCASVLATNDRRQAGWKEPTRLSEVFNSYRELLLSVVASSKELTAAMPPAKKGASVVGDYAGLAWTALLGKARSPNSAAYQPDAKQQAHLDGAERALRWISPDGRCVFGALAHVKGISTSSAIAKVLDRLDDGDVTKVITSAGLKVERVRACILEGRWAEPHVGDVMLDVGAVALDAHVTVLQPGGVLFPINGGGELIVHVTAPLAHYHATNPTDKPPPPTADDVGLTKSGHGKQEIKESKDADPRTIVTAVIGSLDARAVTVSQDKAASPDKTGDKRDDGGGNR